MDQRTCMRCGGSVGVKNPVDICWRVETGCNAYRQHLAAVGVLPFKRRPEPQPCELCGRPTTSKLGVCKTNPACNPEYIRRLRHGENAALPTCSICSQWIRRNNKTGICHRPSCESARAAQWFKNNPGKKSEYDHSTRAKRKAAPFVEDVDPEILMMVLGDDCALCCKPLAGKLHLDHIFPLVRGGEHSYSNTHVTHASCNTSKWSSIWRDPYASVRQSIAQQCRAIAAVEKGLNRPEPPLALFAHLPSPKKFRLKPIGLKGRRSIKPLAGQASLF